jgi:hypothetical protein
LAAGLAKVASGSGSWRRRQQRQRQRQLDYNANFRFSYTKFTEFLYGFTEFLYAPFWFALELGPEGPPDLLADGHLLPHA